MTNWISLIQASSIPKMKRMAKSIKRHWSGILNWFHNKIRNGKVETLNCGIQNLKRIAKGFRTLTNFKALIYLVMVGELLDSPTQNSKEPLIFTIRMIKI